MAHLLIEQLRTDHKHLLKVLYHLEQEIRAYSGMATREASLDQILDVLDYIQVYPESWHHPAEDIIFQHLLEKDLTDSDSLSVVNIMEEHGVLESLTAMIQAHFNALATGQAVAVTDIIKSTYDYVNRQVQHIEQEQNAIFPLLEQYLDEDDWREIKQQIQLRHQTDAPQEKRQEYEQIFQQITDTHVATAR